MGESLKRKQNMDFYVVKEATEGTLIAHTGATDAISITEDDLELNLNRNLLDPGYLTSSLGASAPQPGMWADDLGGQVGFYARGGASSPRPDYHVFLECLFGDEQSQAADTVAAGTLTTDEFTVTDDSKHEAGNLIRVQTAPTVFSIANVLTVPTGKLTVWPPLLESPAASDAIQAAYTYKLLDTGHPTMSMYSFFEPAGANQPRLAYAGCRPRTMSMNFTVGERIPMIFSFSGLTPYRDYTQDTQTPTYQTSPNPLITLGINGSFIYAATVTGSPSTTSTPISYPAFETAVGDYICVNVGSGVYEWRAITGVTGNAGASTVTIANTVDFSGAATLGETCYIRRVAGCAELGDSFDLTFEVEWLPINCITAQYGKLASTFGKRTITLNKNTYFRSWQEYMLRDGVVGAELLIVAGDLNNPNAGTANNIMALYMPNVINTEPSLALDNLIMNPTAMQAVRGTMANNEEEIIMALF